MPLRFDEYAQKGNRFLNELAVELGDEANKRKAGKILRAVFKTLRDHLPLAENFQLLAQLPMALKAVYVDGWMPVRKKEIGKKKIDFVEDVLIYEDKNCWPRVKDVENAVKSVRAVFKTMRKHISQGEFQDIEAVLPYQLKELIRDSVHYRKIKVKLISKK